MTDPIPYATPIRKSRHDTIYTVLLGVMTFFMLIGALDIEYVARQPTQPPEAARIMHLIFEIYLLLVLFATAVLFIRIATPTYRKWATLALNIVMLFLFPFGTALAIYGFLKIDKNIQDPNGG